MVHVPQNFVLKLKSRGSLHLDNFEKIFFVFFQIIVRKRSSGVKTEVVMISQKFPDFKYLICIKFYHLAEI